MNIPPHWKTRAESRGYNPKEMYTKTYKCEWENCKHNASSIHHIKSSYRGSRENQNAKELIGLCIFHHERIHKHSKYENRQYLLNRVLSILEKVNNG